MLTDGIRCGMKNLADEKIMQTLRSRKYKKMVTASLRYNIDNVIETLPGVCLRKGFSVTGINKARNSIEAKKNTFFFWNKLHLNLKIIQLENDVVNVGVKILYKGIPQQKMEEEFVDTLYKFF